MGCRNQGQQRKPAQTPGDKTSHDMKELKSYRSLLSFLCRVCMWFPCLCRFNCCVSSGLFAVRKAKVFLLFYIFLFFHYDFWWLFWAVPSLDIVLGNLHPAYLLLFLIIYVMTALIFMVLLLRGDQNNNNRHARWRIKGRGWHTEDVKKERNDEKKSWRDMNYIFYNVLSLDDGCEETEGPSVMVQLCVFKEALLWIWCRLLPNVMVTMNKSKHAKYRRGWWSHYHEGKRLQHKLLPMQLHLDGTPRCPGSCLHPSLC